MSAGSITEVLDAHYPEWISGMWHCTAVGCSFKGATRDAAIAHQATALSDAGFGLLAVAWDKGRKHGATYPYGARGLVTDDNPYRSGSAPTTGCASCFTGTDCGRSHE